MNLEKVVLLWVIASELLEWIMHKTIVWVFEVLFRCLYLRWLIVLTFSRTYLLVFYVVINHLMIWSESYLSFSVYYTQEHGEKITVFFSAWNNEVYHDYNCVYTVQYVTCVRTHKKRFLFLYILSHPIPNPQSPTLTCTYTSFASRWMRTRWSRPSARLEGVGVNTSGCPSSWSWYQICRLPDEANGKG